MKRIKSEIELRIDAKITHEGESLDSVKQDLEQLAQMFSLADRILTEIQEKDEISLRTAHKIGYLQFWVEQYAVALERFEGILSKLEGDYEKTQK